MSINIQQRLEQLRQKKDHLAARIQKIENSRKSNERKLDTRKKILIGSYYLDKAVKENSYDAIVQIMDSYLTRNSDRKLFGLEPRKDS
jgi:large subunit ribosomal protein L7/L12